MDTFLVDLYAQLPDERLRDVLLNPQDYRREAHWVAEAELARRGVSQAELINLKAAGKLVAEQAKESAELPLSWQWKLGYFLGAWLVLTPFVWLFYRRHAERGHDRRSFESIQWAFLGILFLAALATVKYRLAHYF